MLKKKKGRRRYSEKFKREAVVRSQECDNISALARQLGIDRKMLYQWKWQREGRPTRKPLPLTTQAAEGGSLETLRRENAHLKRVLAEKALEVDFFKGALQKVEARRRGERAGERVSGTLLERATHTDMHCPSRCGSSSRACADQRPDIAIIWEQPRKRPLIRPATAGKNVRRGPPSPLGEGEHSF